MDNFFYVTLAGNDPSDLEETVKNYCDDYILQEHIISSKITSENYAKLKKGLINNPYIKILKKVKFVQPNLIPIPPFNKELKRINKKIKRLNSELNNDFEILFFKKYFNNNEIQKSFSFFKNVFPKLIKIEELPEKTYKGKISNLLKISTDIEIDKKGLFITGGIHGNEWIPPESIIYFVKILCYAYSNNTSIEIGENKYRKDTIQEIVNAINFYIFPLVNPDGRELSQSRSSDDNMIGRKNCNPTENGNLGVDLNRNFDYLWDFGKYYSEFINVPFLSKEPSSYNYIGNCPFSEPESKNVLSVVRKYKSKINYFLDIHSKETGENLILYSWGNSKSQTQYRDMNNSNKNYWGKHGSEFYGEYVEANDFEIRKNIAKSMAIASSKANFSKRNYIAKTSKNLYLMSGTARDFMESFLSFENNSNKIHSFMIEASEKSFNPSIFRRRRMINEIFASIMELCVQIIK
jgi:murein tripeptide amidase MpaA